MNEEEVAQRQRQLDNITLDDLLPDLSDIIDILTRVRMAVFYMFQLFHSDNSYIYRVIFDGLRGPKARRITSYIRYAVTNVPYGFNAQLMGDGEPVGIGTQMGQMVDTMLRLSEMNEGYTEWIQVMLHGYEFEWDDNDLRPKIYGNEITPLEAAAVDAMD